jgi:hypothetical protein
MPKLLFCPVLTLLLWVCIYVADLTVDAHRHTTVCGCAFLLWLLVYQHLVWPIRRSS